MVKLMPNPSGYRQSVAFLWSGLTIYAARCIAAFRERNPLIDTLVIARRSRAPVVGIEDALGQDIHWIEPDACASDWSALGLPVPGLVFQSGFKMPVFNRLGAECRVAGGAVILMTDQNWRGGMTGCILDPLRHRLIIRRRFDGLFVPGKSGARFARRLGYADAVIRQGLYGADPALFEPGLPLDERDKEFIFVGQLIKRKNILGLTEAFIRFSEFHPEWKLRIFGFGAQRASIPTHPCVYLADFTPPDKLAEYLRRARCLVLPSLEEHWGLVVHEATLSGCALSLSHVVGSAGDLATPENSVLYAPSNNAAIEEALTTLANWTPRQWRHAGEISLLQSRQFGPEIFASSVERFLNARRNARAALTKLK